MHNQHYVSAYRMFKDYPIIGIGPKMFRKYCSEKKYKISDYSCTTHPHNFSIQLLSETGLFGFFTYISIYIFFIKDFIKLIFKREINKYYFPFSTSIILNSYSFREVIERNHFLTNKTISFNRIIKVFN